jgi:hypothetical protein
MGKEVILVTGSNGQIGTVLSEALREIYGIANVICSDINVPRNTIIGYFEKLDVLDGKRLNEIIQKYRVTQIYHLAALLSATGEKNPQLAWKVNMDGLFNIVNSLKKTKIKFVAVSERELKNLEKFELHNWMKLETFMEGKNKPFKRIVTAYLIKGLMDKYSDTFQKSERLKPLSEDLANKIDLLEEYKNNHYISSSDKMYSAMLAVAEENNLFDGEVYPIYREVKAFLDRYTFVETILDTCSYYQKENDPMINVLRDMLKYHRRRIDWKNYNIKLNDDVVTKELTEETVEDLLED